MSRKKQLVCHKDHCNEPPHSGGLCREHHERHIQSERSREEAIEALANGYIDGVSSTSHNFREQLLEIRKWWFKACDALNYGRTDTALKDEAQYAVEWCISLAKEIVAAERAFKAGQQPSYMLEHTSGWVYERFSNLERGLMSSGVAHSIK